MSVRVRYAPSPTGLQHIGGVRTALFNYFFARAENGAFILRVEDTDRERYSDEALSDLFETLEWLGISWDEGPDGKGEYGPYIQSERFDLYTSYAKQLVEKGNAYRCYCSSQRLASVREEQKKNKSKVIGYDRHCRDLSEEKQKEYENAGYPYVIRFKVPLEGSTEFEDKIIGKVKRKNEDISPDPVLLKSDGFPTYHLANVIDDHLMNITHIMRAQEWLSSGPLHVLLYRAFGWEPPVYCHLPMVMGKDGQKLSKRHGSTSVREFRDKGYLPEALLNYVALLGWSYDDSREFFTREELEQLFSIEKLNKAPAVFDYKKLEWFNGAYIREKTDEELKQLVLPHLKEADVISDGVTEQENAMLSRLMPLIKERLKYLTDAPELCRFVFRDVTEYTIEDLIPKKLNAVQTLQVLRHSRDIIKQVPKKTEQEIETMLRDTAEALGVKLGPMLMPIRVAITGSKVSPPLIGSIAILGAEKSLDRIDNSIQLLEKQAENA